MKITKAVGVVGVTALVPLVLSMSASPASAMPKNCLSMRLEWEQASLASTHAESTMTSLEDNVHWYPDSDGSIRAKGWYFGFDGSMQTYDIDVPTWDWWDQFDIDQAAAAEAAEAAAYDAYVSDCAW